MNGWSEEVRAIHAEVQDALVFRTDAVRARNPEHIITTHRYYWKPPTQTNSSATETRRVPDWNTGEIGYSTVEVSKVRRKSTSGLSIQCLVEGDWEWIPLKVLKDPHSVGLGSADVEIELATWFVRKMGWAES